MNEIHDMQWLSTASLSMNFVKHFLDYFLNKHQETVSPLPSLKYSNVSLATYNVKSLLPSRKKHETCTLKNL